MEENQQTNVAQPAPCEQATQPVQPAKPVELAPNSHLVWAILCTVFLLPSFGYCGHCKSGIGRCSLGTRAQGGSKKSCKIGQKFLALGNRVKHCMLSIVFPYLFFGDCTCRSYGRCCRFNESIKNAVVSHSYSNTDSFVGYRYFLLLRGARKCCLGA